MVKALRSCLEAAKGKIKAGHLILRKSPKRTATGSSTASNISRIPIRHAGSTACYSCDRKLQRGTQTNVLQPKRCHQLAFPGCCRNFLEAHLPSESPSPQPPIPVTGWALLGPRIFRALRLGPFEGFPDGIDVEANND